MHILEFTAGSLRFLDNLPPQAPSDGFVWIYLERSDFPRHQNQLQAAAQQLGGSALLDVHIIDLGSDAHPSNYDATSIYDTVIFRRLATLPEVQHAHDRTRTSDATPDAFDRIDTRAVGFAIFDRLLISVHPPGCYTASHFVQRSLSDAQLSVDATIVRHRIPQSPSDLVLRLINHMVDSYLDLRKDLSAALEATQHELLRADPHPDVWNAVIHARQRLHVLEDLCEEQHDAMQEWLDTLGELPLSSYAADAAQAQARRDQLMARARDVIEHIDRVLHHARRLEQSTETAVQLHFSAQGQRANDIMRTLTAVTAIFLPLNLFTGFFGMNFDHLPLIHSTEGMWLAMVLMTVLAVGIVVMFWRRRYITRSQR
ncbi:magnesium transporter CorA family protein [Ottowia sp.]|uniref:magnesium transporter CorA family protein n=1 Tax=Ottowia sp. TaxID=1898956 RepID=UPI003A8873EB